MSMIFGYSAEQQAAMDRRRMESDAAMHTMTSMIFTDLSVDQLNALVLMLEGIQYAQAPLGPSGEAARWYGIISAALHTRFNKCIGCGRDHDQEMLDALKDPAPEQAPVTDEDNNIIGFRLPDGTIDNKGLWHPSMGLPQDPDDDDA